MSILAMFSVGDLNCTLTALHPLPQQNNAPLNVEYELWIMDGATNKEWKKRITGENDAFMQFAALIALDDISEVVKAGDMLRNDVSLRNSGLIP